MNTKNILNNIVFREYDKLKNHYDKTKLVIKAYKENQFSNLAFIKHFEDWDEPYFWAQTICLTKLSIPMIMKKFKGNFINDEVYEVIQDFKNTYTPAPSAWELRNNVLKNIEEYNNEYENYIKHNCF